MNSVIEMNSRENACENLLQSQNYKHSVHQRKIVFPRRSTRSSQPSSSHFTYDEGWGNFVETSRGETDKLRWCTEWLSIWTMTKHARNFPETSAICLVKPLSILSSWCWPNIDQLTSNLISSSVGSRYGQAKLVELPWRQKTHIHPCLFRTRKLQTRRMQTYIMCRQWGHLKPFFVPLFKFFILPPAPPSSSSSGKTSEQ